MTIKRGEIYFVNLNPVKECGLNKIHNYDIIGLAV